MVLNDQVFSAHKPVPGPRLWLLRPLVRVITLNTDTLVFFCACAPGKRQSPFFPCPSRVLAEVANVLEPVGLQEEAELPAQILAEFVRNSRKKDKLLCSQLQIADFLQNFLAQEDTAQGLDPLASEDTSRQKAIAAKEQWKDLKAIYQEHVEAIRSTLTEALPQVEEAQQKRVELQDAIEQLQAKKQVAMEKFKVAQKQWQLQQEKHLQGLAKVSAEVKERQTGIQQKLERLYQELGVLKQRAIQEQDKLQRHQTFLQLLYTLQGKPLPEAEGHVSPEAASLPGSS
uniref:ZW10 interacting kinetochore protein n=1 Tax=Chinchilla lanigera TaxID=34839 RepID=A0A8C2VE60_CHILA